MKNLLLLICVFAFVAQDKKKTIMENRARELHRVIGVKDKELWKKFMRDNYSKAMLEKPVKSNIETEEKESTTSATTESADQLEEKAKVFERLHGNFGSSKIVSIKNVKERIEMILENESGLRGDFTLTFEDQSPFLINRIAVEINER
ncbi:MAG TPA: hypothetical protein VIU13_06245 [Chryseolinea sp.]